MEFTFLKSKFKLQDETHFEKDLWHFRNYFFSNKRKSVGAAEKFRNFRGNKLFLNSVK